MDGCPFCDAESFRRDSVVFAENDLALFGNLEDGGALHGSGIVIPRAHRETPFDLRFADEPRDRYGLRWWLRQPENVRPDPSAQGSSRRDFDAESYRR